MIVGELKRLVKTGENGAVEDAWLSGGLKFDVRRKV